MQRLISTVKAPTSVAANKSALPNIQVTLVGIISPVGSSVYSYEVEEGGNSRAPFRCSPNLNSNTIISLASTLFTISGLTAGCNINTRPVTPTGQPKQESVRHVAATLGGRMKHLGLTQIDFDFFSIYLLNSMTGYTYWAVAAFKESKIDRQIPTSTINEMLRQMWRAFADHGKKNPFLRTEAVLRSQAFDLIVAEATRTANHHMVSLR